MVSTSAWRDGGPGTILGHGRHGIFGVKTWLSTLGLCFPREPENHVNVGPVSIIWDGEEKNH